MAPGLLLADFIQNSLAIVSVMFWAFRNDIGWLKFLFRTRDRWNHNSRRPIILNSVVLRSLCEIDCKVINCAKHGRKKNESQLIEKPPPVGGKFKQLGNWKLRY